MKIVINRSFGCFKIPPELAEELGWYSVYFNGSKDLPADYDEHTDPDLIAGLERMIEVGVDISKAAGTMLKIVEIPDDVEWFIDDYDGIETIHERHRTWS